ncbi:MAG: MBL fold metallo-hydrolase [Aquificota bacterium]|nr:MAG: MBL fold metallo-hydrolase [Aquificota bacterium]
MFVKVVPVGLLSVNCSIIVDEESKKALVVDPGGDAERLIKELEGYQLVGIVATHGHIDHVGQVKTLRERFNVPFYMHPADRFLINDPIWPGFERQIGANLPCPEPDIELYDQMEIALGENTIKVFHTPGHTPGLCCLYLPKEEVLIAGDLLFKGSVGRWDLPGGDLKALKASLKRLLSTLEDHVLVVCGHYEETTVQEAKRTVRSLFGII